MKRLIAIAFFGAGYVAGAAAGRGRYEQIRRVALRVKEDPHVQDLGTALTEKVTEKVVNGEHAAREALDGLSNPYQRATP